MSLPIPSGSNLDSFNTAYMLWLCLPCQPLFLPLPCACSEHKVILNSPHTLSWLHVFTWAASCACILCPHCVHCEISIFSFFARLCTILIPDLWAQLATASSVTVQCFKYESVMCSLSLFKLFVSPTSLWVEKGIKSYLLTSYSYD